MPTSYNGSAMDESRIRTDLFAPFEPFEKGWLDVGDGHRIYWEQSGHPEGRPVVFLHGGPGAGASPNHRRFFDPLHYRIVIFDQRGCGRSLPHGSTVANTTPHLVEDMERLRRMLDIERWLVFGGSWGASLALAYGIAHPERCSGFVLRGVFLCRRREVDWFLYGMRTVFPEAWAEFAAPIPAGERDDLLGAYWRRLDHPDPAVHFPAARAWSRYETVCSTLLPPDPDMALALSGDAPAALGLARLEAHYFRNALFMPEGHLLAGVHRLRHRPAIIVQGRYDMICPAVNARELADAWPDARYVVVPDAGHSVMEPGIRRALVGATESLKTGWF
ncbi:MAG: prolyl aminopeptidase [Magnetospirillum sp. WYHS-4]